MIGKVDRINKVKSIISIKLDEDIYCIIQYFDLIDLSIDDVLLLDPIVKDVFVKNETKNNYFQATVLVVNCNENKMLIALNQHIIN